MNRRLAAAMLGPAACSAGGIAPGPSGSASGETTDGGGRPTAGSGSSSGGGHATLGGGFEGGEAASDPGSGSGSAGGGPGPHELIGASPYPRLLVEIDRVPGLEPRPAVTADIVTLLGRLVDKPGGIEAVIDGEIASRGAEHAWTAEERGALGLSTDDLAVAGDTTKIHVMFVDGHAAENQGQKVMLGFGWGHRHIVLFKEGLDGGCQDPLVGALTDTLCAQTEYLVWSHELGHVLGLVDFGLPMVMDHRDPDPSHGPHDLSRDCAMYFAYSTMDAVDALADRLLMAGAPPIELDAPCLADISAAR